MKLAHLFACHHSLIINNNNKLFRLQATLISIKFY
jgi:hypothetical protein